MNLIREIFDWMKRLPAWQQDAARRLYEKPDGLTDVDYQELVRLALKENGLASDEILESVPMDLARLQQNISDHTLVLKSLRSLQHVNKIDPSSKINFSSSGMTIVYGNNGTGKSGYARVFKKACFCRDVGKEVLSDVNNEEEQCQVASATFDVVLNGVDTSIEWRNGTMSPELTNVSVFDLKSARIILDSEQEPRYIPYGLDILTELGSVVLPKVKQEIEGKWKTIDLSEDCFTVLQGTTTVGKVFANLERTTVEDVRSLGEWTEADSERDKYLSKFLADNNYQMRIKENKFATDRLSAIIAEVEAVSDALNDKKVGEWKQTFDKWKVAKEAEALAAQNLRSGESLLSGTGDEAWKLMFIKAQEFVSGTNRLDSKIIDLAKCPLCQQEMSANARARVKRFAEYVSDRVSVELQTCAKVKVAAIATIDEIVVDVVRIKANLDEIENLSTGAAKQYEQFVSTCAERKDAIQNAMLGLRVWNDVPSIDFDIISTLHGVLAHLEYENAELQQTMAARNLELLKAEYDELRARYRLHQMLETVEGWFRKREFVSKLKSVSHNISTLNITTKCKVLAQEVVCKPLCSSIDAEFRELGISTKRLCPALVSKGKKGKLYNGFELNAVNRQPLSAVLSEGEQKVIAIASFLAELDVSGHNQAIVFDDPMTSLDHMRRNKIAHRLAKEALKRQVIVFSHEPVFVTSLINMCLDVGAENLVQTLTWNDNGRLCGVVMPGMPWVHKTYRTRISELRNVQAKLSKVVGEYANEAQTEEIRRLYGRMRATIELVAQEVCLCGTVRRFEDEIKMAKLTEVSPLDSQAVSDLYGLFGKCSDIFEGHDHASEANGSVPLPNEICKDLDLLDNIIGRVKDARKR